MVLAGAASSAGLTRAGGAAPGVAAAWRAGLSPCRTLGGGGRELLKRPHNMVAGFPAHVVGAQGKPPP